MDWTVSRRIALAFAISIALLVSVAGVGWWSLRKSTASAEQALRTQRASLIPALEAESELRGANIYMLRFLLEREARHERGGDSALVVARQRIDLVRRAARDEGERGRWNDIGAIVDRWTDALKAATAAARVGNEAEALRIRATQVQPLRDQIDARIRDEVSLQMSYADSIAALGRDTALSARAQLLGGVLLAIVAALISAFVLGRAINGPLQNTASILASSAAEILAATTEQAAGINESMAAVSETVATVEEVSQTAAQAAERARVVADSAQRAVEGGEAGRRAVEESTRAMKDVQAQVETIGRSTVALAEQAQAIGEIIAAVSEIAEQTKMLALNAAVESARAGEHGRGFAVVAAEIKELAGQAKQSTGQVRQLLGDIQRATNAAVIATEQGTKRVSAAAEQVAHAGQIIASLGDMVADASQAATQIAASAGQQSLGMEQIRQAVGNIHDATQQSLTATRQSEQAARDLNRLGTSLVNLVGVSRARGVNGSGSAFGGRA